MTVCSGSSVHLIMVLCQKYIVSMCNGVLSQIYPPLNYMLECLNSQDYGSSYNHDIQVYIINGRCMYQYCKWYLIR